MGIMNRRSRSVNQTDLYTGASSLAYPVVIRSTPNQVRRLPRQRIRGFAGANTGRLMSGWSSTPRTPNEVIYDDLTTLRARSRDSFHNNDFVRQFVRMVRSNVVGPKGVSLQGQIIGSRGDLDRPANDAVEAAWSDWGRAENCDLRQRLSWVQLQQQAAGSAVIDGEIFARLIRAKDAGPHAFMVQHMDPEALDVKYNAPVRGGGQIKLGIELDGFDRPIAYHVREYSGIGYVGPTGKSYIRIPADEIIHGFLPEQVNQVRGYPWTSTAMQRLKLLDKYFEAATTAALAGASKMGFITSPDGTGYIGDDVDADGAVISEFEPGIIEQLMDGQSFQPFDPRYPHEQFPTFVKSCLQAIGGSLGVSYAGLSNDLEGVNYSSIRAGVLEERETWKAIQEWFIDIYCRPIYAAWLGQARLVGAVTVFGKPLSGPDSKYLKVSWQPRRWAWVDPQKDMDANISAIENNITTVSSVIREQGKDPDEVFLERAAEKARMRELGLTAPEAVTVPASGQQEQESEDGDE